jgi:hypothetical protein
MTDLSELVDKHDAGEIYFSYSKQVLNLSEFVKRKRSEIRLDLPMLLISFACIVLLLYMYFFLSDEQIMEMLVVIIVISISILAMTIFIGIAFLLNAKKILSAVGTDGMYTTAHVAICQRGVLAFFDTTIIGVQQVFLPWNQINKISVVRPSRGFVQFLKTRKNLAGITKNIDNVAIYRIKSRKNIKTDSRRLKRSYWSNLGTFVDINIPKKTEIHYLSAIKKAGQGVRIRD